MASDGMSPYVTLSISLCLLPYVFSWFDTLLRMTALRNDANYYRSALLYHELPLPTKVMFQATIIYMHLRFLHPIINSLTSDTDVEGEVGNRSAHE
jgi:hypothetical protein